MIQELRLDCKSKNYFNISRSNGIVQKRWARSKMRWGFWSAALADFSHKPQRIAAKLFARICVKNLLGRRPKTHLTLLLAYPKRRNMRLELIHPMLVHFPIALFCTGLVLRLVACWAAKKPGFSFLLPASWTIL